MGLINGALQIGRTAIVASQTALTVTGNNMANAATPSYTRQQVHLAPNQTAQIVQGIYSGTGVSILDISRQVDDALNGRIRTAVGDSASYLVQQQVMSRVESTFNELTDQDLSTRLNKFFAAWSSLQQQPQDSASRNVVLQEGTSLSSFIRETRNDLSSIQTDLDSQVRSQVSQADALAQQVAELNSQIVTSEAGLTGSAGALRDQRDELLKQLSELINITTREVDGGAVNVFVGNDPLIQYSQSRGLNYVEKEDANGAWLAQVTFTDNNQALQLTSGKIQGLVTGRDDQLGSIIGQLDTWTSSLISEVNQLHSLGQGLDRFSEVTGGFSVSDANASLADMTATDLKWQTTNGVFNINVYDSSGNLVTTRAVQVQIGIDATDTTLNSLVSDINLNVPNVTASVDGSNRLHIEADNGFTFAFSAPQDTVTSDAATNALAVLGVNTFFQGFNADTLAVRSDLAGDPRKLATSANGLPGNGSVAGAIAQLATAGVTSLNGLSLTDHLNSMIGRIATDSKGAQDNYAAADVVAKTLESERQSISGVSTDEEAINMITYQRAFQGAARYISLVNQMMDEVINLLQ